MKYIILTIVIFFIGIRLSMPQENLPTNIDNVLDSTYTKLQLPPLQVFLNAVYNNASVQIRKEITEEEKSALQAEKIGSTTFRFEEYINMELQVEIYHNQTQTLPYFILTQVQTSTYTILV